MAEVFNADKKLTLEELASQLRQPSGELGRIVGIEMNKGNKDICLNTYKVLDPKSGSHILEIGMGNGFFIRDLLSMSERLTYVGVDYSPTMIDEASRINQDLMDAKIVTFRQASIDNLPFEDESFDCISTTNTLYFWPDLKTSMLEILRVLKPEGKFLVAYRSKSCMDQMDVTQQGFMKYEAKDIEKAFESCGFELIDSKYISEPKLEMGGKKLDLEGIYTYGQKP